MGYRIPFNRPECAGLESAYLQEALQSPQWSGDGPFTKKCHALLERVTGVKKALLTTSCTHALEMAALLLDLRPGEEVIVPSFTFVSTANAFYVHGARPVFVDVRPDTLNLDERRVESAITSRTRAIVAVHYAGVACEMDALMDIAARHGILLIEDNAHGLFGSYKGQPLGSFGQLATLSFHETKNITCGEGGALLINDLSFAPRAEILREKGTNRSRFFRGEVDKYTWVDKGSSFLPSDLLAAVLCAQLERAELIQAKRREIWQRYWNNLQSWAPAWGIRLPVIPPECGCAWHMFYVLMPDEATRSRVIARLKQRGILAVFHYLPLHLSDVGRALGGRAGDCPVTEDVSERLLRLPMFAGLSLSEVDEICAAFKEAVNA
ncbi:MAG: dTDP-4-amino-4,6-dideoxygalactose transaminase [Kiritimatiellae bacterium]|nr:dTDP-4-amino-4,6-dideoxygalactose transaminase [Kiritimatiellia bacterium]MDW8459537.1 dTDP-4-amino-4,6-dideoxygalactose transaminase [Verrucomicrobiota bacterium]